LCIYIMAIYIRAETSWQCGSLDKLRFFADKPGNKPTAVGRSSSSIWFSCTSFSSCHGKSKSQSDQLKRAQIKTGHSSPDMLLLEREAVILRVSSTVRFKRILCVRTCPRGQENGKSHSSGPTPTDKRGPSDPFPTQMWEQNGLAWTGERSTNVSMRAFWCPPLAHPASTQRRPVFSIAGTG
jgi:hypothetical protein